MAMLDTITGRAALARATTEAPAVRALLITAAGLFLGVVLFLTLLTVFIEAFRKGWGVFADTFQEPDTQAAVRLWSQAEF